MKNSGRYLRIVALALGLAVLVLMLLYLMNQWQQVASPGPSRSGHEALVCADCHRQGPHQRQQLEATCLECHGDQVQGRQRVHSRDYLREQGSRGKAGFLSASDCLSCHRHHRRRQQDVDQRLLLPKDVCAACHADIARSGRQDAFDHSQADQFPSCSVCHQYHEPRLSPLKK